MKEILLGSFEQLFSSGGCHHLDLVLDKVPCKVSADMNMQLLAPFTAADIERALNQMPNLKSPGFDGFPVLFFKTF